MRAMTFLPGEEPGVEQFGPSGKGRFFTAGVYFERLEAQVSKRARQVRKQVEADWGSRAKLTRRWTKILRKRRGVRMRKISRARTWGSEISWTSRRDNIVLLKGMTLPVWIPFVVDGCLGYINSKPGKSPYILWGDPLPGRASGHFCAYYWWTGASAGFVAYNWPERSAVQREGYPFYTQEPYRYLGLQNRGLAMQEDVILPQWRPSAYLPADPRLRAQILELFKCSEQQPNSALMVWANASQTWKRKRNQRLTGEQQQTIQELQMIQRAVWAFQWKLQQRQRAAVFRAWQAYTREIPRAATTARVSINRLRVLHQTYNTW